MSDQDLGMWPVGESGEVEPVEAGGAEIDFSVVHPARRYDYWLGGKNNFAVDRASGDAIAARFPTIRVSTMENRRFLGRAVRYLAAEAGIDQFLDIGTGLPAEGNTHEVAQQIVPGARVVYVDNDRVNSGCVHTRLELLPQGPGPSAQVGGCSRW